jgi:plasmid stabilization system protein ParE
MKPLVWTQIIDADIQEIYERLEHRQEDAGDLFYRQLLKTVETLSEQPYLGKVVFGEHVRQMLVYRRKFGIFYTVESRGLILHRLLDLRQDPARIEHYLRQI